MSSPHKSAVESLQDGRLARSQRSRTAIVDAVIELVGEGMLRPTAERVAERAGVGIRTVFRHFSDMDRLLAAVSDRVSVRFSSLLQEPPPEGGLEERLAALVRTRCQLLEALAPHRRAADLMRWKSDLLQDDHLASNRVLRVQVLKFIPELSEGSPETIEVFDLLLSFPVWDRLRTDQRLGVVRARELIEHLLRAELEVMLD